MFWPAATSLSPRRSTRIKLAAPTVLQSNDVKAQANSPGLHRSFFKNGLAATGPVTDSVTGPRFGSAVNSNRRKGQHSRSAVITSAKIEIHSFSPGAENANPSASSVTCDSAALNRASSSASRSRNSASVNVHAIEISSGIIALRKRRACVPLLYVQRYNLKSTLREAEFYKDRIVSW